MSVSLCVHSFIVYVCVWMCLSVIVHICVSVCVFECVITRTCLFKCAIPCARLDQYINALAHLHPQRYVQACMHAHSASARTSFTASPAASASAAAQTTPTAKKHLESGRRLRLISRLMEVSTRVPEAARSLTRVAKWPCSCLAVVRGGGAAYLLVFMWPMIAPSSAWLASGRVRRQLGMKVI